MENRVVMIVTRTRRCGELTCHRPASASARRPRPAQPNCFLGNNPNQERMMRTKRHPPIAFIALDVLCAPIAMLCGIPLSLIRRVGLQRLLLTKRVLHAVGMLPIRHHYYEPLVYAEDLRSPLDAIRSLQGLDLNTEAQLTLLSRFEYSEELKRFPLHDAGNGQFYYSNGMFEVGDAEILYCVIRHFKPARILEV